MIHFFEADISYSLRQKRKIKDWLVSASENEGKTIENLNIILCSDEYLYKLNLQYLNHRTYTDIITFDQSIDKKNISGELYISLERVRDNAQSLSLPVRDELHRVMIHGVLHLCGYGDKTPGSKKKMRTRENYYLAKRSF